MNNEESVREGKGCFLSLGFCEVGEKGATVFCSKEKGKEGRKGKGERLMVALAECNFFCYEMKNCDLSLDSL